MKKILILLITALISLPTLQAQEIINKVILHINDSCVLHIGDDIKVMELNKGKEYHHITVYGRAAAKRSLLKMVAPVLVSKTDFAGKILRITKFKETGNERKGWHYYAITEDDKGQYEVEVIPALKAGEVTIL